MRTSTVLKCVLLTMFFPLVTVRAQSVVYSGPLGSPTIQLLDLARTYNFNVPIVSAGEQISVDPTGLTLSYQNFRFQTSSFTVSRNLQITAGFGVTKDYTISLTFNAATFNFNDGGANHTLTATTGGASTVSGAAGYVTPSGAVNLTGSFTITGPTQTSTGTFLVPANVASYMIIADTINTSNYPSQLSLSHSNNHFHAFMDFVTGANSNVNFASATVDGSLVTWGFEQLHFEAQFGTVTPGALSAIPEPSTYAAIFGVTVLGFAVYRKRKNSV